MWDRKICLPVVLVAVSALAGCAVTQDFHWSKARPRPAVASQADLATFNEAVALAESLRYEAAADKFKRVFDNFALAGDRQRAAEALFWLGFCREKQKRLAEARAIYVRLAEEYSETPAAGEAAKRLSSMSAAPVSQLKKDYESVVRVVAAEM